MESFKEMVPRAHQPIVHRSVARFRTPTLLVALVLVASAPLLQAQPPGSVPFDAPFTSSEELLEQAAYTVAQCFIGGVIVQSTAPDPILPAIGNFFLNSADAVTDTEVLCTDCGQFGAIVTSVGEPQACASGATPCIEVQLTTRPALPQEVLTPEALQILNLSESGDVPLFAAVSEGCEAESGRRLAGFTGPHRALLQNRPSSCGGWSAVGDDGCCVYSDCYVGKPPPANPNCFDCMLPGYNCDNGCGAADGFSSLAPENVPFIFDFSDACCNHDFCYASTSFTKRQCDSAFLRDMLQNCRDRNPIIRVLVFFLTPQPARLLTNCNSYALLYYAAVSIGGTAAEAAAKENTMRHEQSGACTKPEGKYGN